MKKIILLLTVCSCMLCTLNAQNRVDIRKKFVFGLKVGTNLSNVYDSQGEDFHSNAKLGLATGAFMAIPIGRFLGIQPELLFSQKGFQGTGRLSGASYNLTRTTDYIDVPLFFAFKPIGLLTILAGPQFSYLTKRNDVFANGTTTVQQEQQFSNEDLRKNILSFSSGIDLNLRHIVLSARMAWDVQHDNVNGSSYVPRYKNVWFQTTIGYRFYKR